jgi:hypothetical protein
VGTANSFTGDPHGGCEILIGRQLMDAASLTKGHQYFINRRDTSMDNAWLKRIGILWIVFVVVFSLAGCSSSDDDDDDTGTAEEQAETLDLYKFSAQVNQESPITVTFNADGQDADVILSTTSGSIAGTYRPPAGEMTISSGSIIDLDASALFEGGGGILTIRIVEDLIVQGDEAFEGEFDVVAGAGAVTINVKIENSSVTISDGTNSLTLTIDDFEDLFEEGVLLWQRYAGFAFNVGGFLFEQFYLVIEALEYIDENYDELVNSFTLVTMCDAFPAGAAPSGVSEQGSFSVTWIDDSGNFDLGPGDSFVWYFSDCWENDEFDDIDNLINGGVNLVGYTEVSEIRDSTNVITRIGFEPYIDSPGGVEFLDLTIAETQEDPPGTFVVDENSVITINGGFSIVFFE